MNSDNKTLLLIDDEATLLSSLNNKFTSEGYNVLQARDGEVGLEIALREHPDIILLDIIMPKMDGMTLLKKLKETEKGKDTPVVILTNLSSEETKKKGKEFGASEVIIKAEISIDELVKKVENILKK
ncbi:MAG: response regulator [bacterium]